jgi:subtilisin family serine protease
MPHNRRILNVETLERRQLLSASAPSPEWFAALPKPAELAVGPLDRPSMVAIEWKGQETQVRPGEWLVQFNDDALSQMSSVADAQGFLSDAPFSLRVDRGLGLPGMVKVETSASSDEMSAWLGSLSTLATFEPNFVRNLYIEEPNDPGYEFDYALDNQGFFPGSIADADMDVLEAWDITTGDASVVVAVNDTGVNYLHEDLAANMWVNPGEIPGNARDDDGNGFIDDIHGWDFGEQDNDPMDEEGHGTAVAGTIGAVGNNGIGTVGVNWNVQIMALKIALADGSLDSEAIIQADNYTSMMRLRGTNIRASNHSYGGAMGSDLEFAAVNAQRDAGILFVAAAGNDTLNNDRNGSFPSNYNLDNVLAVAATDAADALATFSNFGVNTVDVGAPGVEIMTTMVEGGYGYIDGTSFSSPYTAGVAALVSSHATTASYQLVRQAIMDGADRIPSLNGKVFTGGRVNAFNALQRIEELAPAVAEISANGNLILDGDLTPSIDDNTDFGSISAANGRTVHPFTLTNAGGVPLELSEIVAVKITGPNAADFQVSPIPTRVVYGNESTQFSVTFDPLNPGTKSALVTIDFATAGSYSFAIQGVGLAPPPPWQNTRDKYDVNNDGNVSGLDVLVLINELNRNGARELPPIGPGTAPPPYYDVSGDGNLTVIDTLQVVNYINSRPVAITSAPSTEGTVSLLKPAAESSVAGNHAADLLFSAAWERAADDLATSFGRTARGNGKRGLI